MLRTLRRLPALVVLLTLSLVLGPAASALCAELNVAHAMPAMEEGGAEPCHEDTGAPVAPPVGHGGSECTSACCLGAAETPTLTPPVPPLVATVVVSVEGVRPAPPVAGGAEPSTRPPPLRLYLETGCFRV